MILCLDVGNSHIYAGLFKDNDIKLTIRYPSNQALTSDTLGFFLRQVIRENTFDPDSITKIGLCSVVPSLDYSVQAACKKYFKLNPIELKPGVKTGIKLDVKNPLEVGSDRIAKIIAATEHFKAHNVIIVDFGTATTLCAVSKNKVFLGGAILPGVRISMEALSQKTANLYAVDILAPECALGKTTEANIQSGIYYSQLGAILELKKHFTSEAFKGEASTLIATGGYGALFKKEKIFAAYLPDLVLHGLRIMVEKT